MDTSMTVSPIDSSTMLAVSPLDTHHSHGSPPSPLTWTMPVLPPRAPRRSATVPAPLPPLSFTKVSVRSAPSSAAPTDSEATGSEWPGAELSRSPSLLTSLIQSQSRLSSRNVSPSASAATSPGTLLSPLATLPRTRPILRRSSTTSTSDEAEFVHGARKLSGPLDAVLESACEPTSTGTSPEAAAKVSTPPLHRRRSCLKFAVTPRPLQLSMPSSSACSSRRTSPRAEPARQLPLVEDGDEDEVDELEEEVATPGWHSDSDGYKEDSEDGFTSDEDAGMLSLAGPSRRIRPWVPWTAREPAPILATARRRQVTLPEPSTDDCGPVAPVPRRARVQIRDDDERPDRHERKSKGRCSRHRSPPPAHRGAVFAEAPPPAARSPSAFDLCRRRKGVAREPSVRLSHVLRAASRGWRSDDGTITPEGEAALGVAPVRPGMRLSRNCSAPAVVKFGPTADDANRATLALSGGESAPPRVDEVHVLAKTSASASEWSCPRRGLRRVLGAVKGERRSS